MPEFVIALTTCPKDKSEELARSLVEERVCACVNIVSSVKSIYHWKGKIVTEEESLLIMKTQEVKRRRLSAALLNYFFLLLRNPYSKDSPNKNPTIVVTPHSN